MRSREGFQYEINSPTHDRRRALGGHPHDSRIVQFDLSAAGCLGRELKLRLLPKAGAVERVRDEFIQPVKIVRA